MKENKQPILSICIPTWNRGYVIEKTINSVCTQPEFESGDIELIISDNASTDNTEQIIKKFQGKYKNIKYFRNDSNIGGMKNIVKSYSLGTGKYLWCFGSDDFLSQGCLGYTLKIINSYSPTIIVHRNCTTGKIFNKFKNEYFQDSDCLYKFDSQKSYLDYLGDQFNFDKNSFDVLESQLTRISGYIISSEHYRKSKNNIIQEYGIDFFNSFNFIQTLIAHSVNVDNTIILSDNGYVGQDVGQGKNYEEDFEKSMEDIKGKGVSIFYKDFLFLLDYSKKKYTLNKNAIYFLKSSVMVWKLCYIANIPFIRRIKSIINLKTRRKLGGIFVKLFSK